MMNQEEPCSYGSSEEFNFRSDLSKSARVSENYARSSNFITYLKDITSIKQAMTETMSITDEPEDVNGVGNESGELESVWQYLDNFYEFSPDDGLIDGGRNVLPIVLDKTKFETINTTELPDLNSYEGIVLIEFFTHCCINCIHSIEDVRQVYEDVSKSDSVKGSNDLKIVSIHSPKFTREKELESIKAFTEQFKMDYSDVINDPGCELWNELGISCWPTLLILGPNPSGNGMNLLFTMMGEGHKHVLGLILSSALSYFRHKLRKNLDTIDEPDTSSSTRKTTASVHESRQSTKSILRYPGKVNCFDELLAIADTGNHRILISDLNGCIHHAIGGSEGYADGDLSQAKFYFPQGIAFRDKDLLYVADTGNHSIRQINLKLGKVSTLIPPGWNYTHDNDTVHLRSPWDVALFSQEILLVAAAGNHRIFAYFFEPSNLFASEFSKDSFAVVAGTGKEENRNNSYILKASFAQPSGICVMNSLENSKVILIADSESSSIRCITTEGKGKVSAVVGGARDPTDLFSYGDVDGKGINVKLQHPMGICSYQTASKAYFVDTYNNKIKVVDVSSQACEVLCGNGTPGNIVGDIANVEFNEPGGICISENGETLFVADTNNHSIKSINLQCNSVTNIVLKLPHENETKADLEYDDTFSLGTMSAGNSNFKICIANVPENFEGGQWRLIKKQDGVNKQPASIVISGQIVRDASGTTQILVQLPAVELAEKYSMIADIFLCGPSSCYKKTLSFLIKLNSNQIHSETTCFKYEPNSSFFI